jgi:ankyrin repeat protein
VENVRALLRAGADADARDAAGDCALALADRANRRHAALALREHRGEYELYYDTFRVPSMSLHREKLRLHS